MARYDSLKVVATLQEGSIKDLQAAVAKQVIDLNECQLSRDRLNLVVNNFQTLQQADKVNYSNLEKMYKKEVRAGRFKFVLLVGLAVLTGYALLK